VHHAAQATPHWELAATQWTEFESKEKSPTSPGESRARLPAGLLPHRHLWCHRRSTWSSQKRTVRIKDGNLLPLLLQVTFASPTICNCLFHIFGLSMLSNVVKETAVTTLEKKHGVSTNWPNIATKFARRGTIRSLLLPNWSSWRRAASATQRTEFESIHKSTTSPGESCARLPAGLRPHLHLWCLCQSTWSAQKGTVGIKGLQSVAAPLANDFCKSDHFATVNFTFLACQCCQMLSKKQP